MKLPVIAVLLLTAVASLPCLADIAPEPLFTGGAGITVKGKPLTVEMAWEEVDLHPTADWNRVKALFGMRNTGRENATLEVGFPSYFQLELNDFRVSVDGRPVEAERKVDDVSAGDRKRLFVHWMCWTMTFPPGREVKIEVSYQVKTGRTFKDLWIEDLPEDLQAALWTRESGYVLRTGARWAGKIGRAEIRLHYGAEVKKEFLSFAAMEPGGTWTHDAKAGTDTLVLKDFEPDDRGWSSTSDVVYTFRTCSYRDQAVRLSAALKEKRLGPWAMQRLLDLVERDEDEDGAERWGNVLELPADKRGAEALAILEAMVPPAGPEIDPAKVSRGAFAILHDAYRRLMKQHQAAGAAAKIQALRPFYRGFLEKVLAHDAWYADREGVRQELEALARP